MATSPLPAEDTVLLLSCIAGEVAQLGVPASEARACAIRIMELLVPVFNDLAEGGYQQAIDEVAAPFSAASVARPS